MSQADYNRVTKLEERIKALEDAVAKLTEAAEAKSAERKKAT